jgi:molybdenum cofactor biosynthesis protein MoaC
MGACAALRHMGTVPERTAVKPSHIRRDGSVTMVDVSAKSITSRTACAEAIVAMSSGAQQALRATTLPKGDALVTAQIAGIMAAKQTAALIPLAHTLPLSSVDVRFEWRADGALRIEAEARTAARTGVEMEAMVAAAIAALTIYDMSKALDKAITIESVRLVSKSGGKSGDFRRRASAGT